MTRRAPFSAIHSAGGLLPNDLLQRIASADQDLAGIKPPDYYLGKHERIGEQINRSWTRLLSAWSGFDEARQELDEDQPGTAITRERLLLPLFAELGYGRLVTRRALEIEGRTYPLSHGWARDHTRIHLLGCGVPLDRRSAHVAGAARTSPHGLVQEFLNRSDAHLWALLSNGLALRLLRDHQSLTRQAYVEFDLEQIFEGELFAEFAVLWMVCHVSRVDTEQPADCWLERWFGTARDEGVRARELLRDGVQNAIEALGSGFVRHPGNEPLRRELTSGALTTQDYYRQLLRLVYRLIFLFVAEDRDVLLDPEASPETRALYRRWYATSRIRELALRRLGGPHPDLWHQLRVVMGHLHDGCADLGVSALGSWLWRERSVQALAGAELANADLLAAVRALCAIRDRDVTRPVDWRNLDAEELGAVYESLLELHPELNTAAGTFALRSAAGSERKTTGSYYTPDPLIQSLLDTALEPVIAGRLQHSVEGIPATDEQRRNDAREQALLSLRVCDPACGSGHFLLAAARRIARRLVQVRSGDEEPAPGALRDALRDVIARCIYGVDINPMAVELTKVSLWMEAMEPRRPLPFLEGHVVCGNALLGATPRLIAGGIPDDAFKPIEGDDRKVAGALKRRNKKEHEGQTSMFGLFAAEQRARYGGLQDQARAVEGRPDHDLAAVQDKERAWEALRDSHEYRAAGATADAWCAAFVWHKTPEWADLAVTEDMFRRIQHQPDQVKQPILDEVQRLAGDYAFLHWHLAFPQVFAVPDLGDEADNEEAEWSGGFDCVLGNPPWEHVEIQEKEWFAVTRPDIANASNAAARKKKIRELEGENPRLYARFTDALRRVGAETHFVRDSSRYPLCARGRINTYPLFSELNRALVGLQGRAGFIVPSGIATDATTQAYFRELVETSRLVSLYHFENEDLVFPAVHHAFRFCLLTLSGSPISVGAADLVFYARQVEHLADGQRHFRLTAADFQLLNPNTKTCPTFRGQRDAEITKGIYRNVPVLLKEGSADGNPWDVQFRQGIFNMASDSCLFRTDDELEAGGWNREGNVYWRAGARALPLLEAKMVHHFDHRFGTYEGQTQAQANQGKLPETDPEQHADPGFLTQPRYWVAEADVAERLEGRWDREWLLGWRDICRATDQRTVIASAFPRVAVGHTTPLMMTDQDPRLVASMYANLCSTVLDYAARQKIGGTHVTYSYFKQLPVFFPQFYDEPCPWCSDSTIGEWLLPRVLELTYTAWDLEPFARDCGYEGPPFRWDEDRRFMLRCELDAAFFHLYGVARDDVDYIMETFPVVRRNDDKTFGDYRTKLLILDLYDQLQHAIDTGVRYETILDPPPADPAVAHPARVAAEPEPVAFPDLAALADDAWTRSHPDPQHDTIAALAAVLQVAGGPAPARLVRIAAYLVLEPTALAPFMDDAHARDWRRVVGVEARPRPANTVTLVPRSDRFWSGAVTHLRGNGQLVEDLAADTWAPGTGLDRIDTEGWPQGRARAVWTTVRDLNLGAVEVRVAEYEQEVGHATA